MELPSDNWDMLFMSDEAGIILDGRGNTQEILGEPLKGLMGASVYQLISSLDSDALKKILVSEYAYTEAVIKFRVHGKWEVPFYTSANKVGEDQPFWILLRKLPDEEGGGVMLPIETVERTLIPKGEIAIAASEHQEASFIEIMGLGEEEMELRYGADIMARVRAGVAQAIVGEGLQSVSKLSEERFAILHDGQFKVEHVSNLIRKDLDRSKISGPSVSSRSVKLDLAGEEAAEGFDRLLADFESKGIEAVMESTLSEINEILNRLEKDASPKEATSNDGWGKLERPKRNFLQRLLRKSEK